MEKILVPLDGNINAERELALASQLLPSRGVLLLLRVPVVPDEMADDPLVTRTAVWQDQLEIAQVTAETYLEETIRRWQARHPEISCRAIVETGDPAEVIAAVAARENVDLTIMATHGRERFGQWLLGGVAERAVRQACCPILLLRNTSGLRHIVVALDGSPFAEQILAFVAGIGASVSATVTLLQVVSDTTTVATAHAYLDRISTEFPYPVQIEILHGRAPALEIIDYIAANEVDLLALATHGMSGTLAGMYGSVAEKVVRNVDSSMLILRPDTAVVELR
jgi:nucleotide-binding universal stress UspA family protein